MGAWLARHGRGVYVESEPRVDSSQGAVPCACRVLPRNHAEPGGELAAVLEPGRLTDGHDEGGGRPGSNPFDESLLEPRQRLEPCCSTRLMRTKRMVGRVPVSQMASASR